MDNFPSNISPYPAPFGLELTVGLAGLWLVRVKSVGLLLHGCFNSDCDVVHFVSRHGVYYRRMLSAIGRNSLFCCRRFGVRLSAIAHINKFFVWAHYNAQLSVSYCRTVHLLLELLFVKFGYFSVSCLSQADITDAVDSICIS